VVVVLAPAAADGEPTFDKLSSVFLSGNRTRDDQPNHIRIQRHVPRELAEMWTAMCPAHGRTFPPTRDLAQLRATYTNRSSRQMFHQEWSDHWNGSVPIELRLHYLKRMYDVFKALADEDKYEGFNAWDGWSTAVGAWRARRQR